MMQDVASKDIAAKAKLLNNYLKIWLGAALAIAFTATIFFLICFYKTYTAAAVLISVIPSAFLIISICDARPTLDPAAIEVPDSVLAGSITLGRKLS
jgi:hypothetical protein